MAQFKPGDKVYVKGCNIPFEVTEYHNSIDTYKCVDKWGFSHDFFGKDVVATMEDRITDPKTGGQKGVKLERYELLPDDALDEIARVYGEGAKKYEDRNWEKGYKWGYSIGALKRHISLFCQGHDYDTGPGGTNRHHMACAAWHCLCLLAFSLRGLGTDDRVKVAK